MSEVKPQPPRRYAGQTVAERVSERRQALLEAAFELVAETGWGGLRIETLCRQAGLNKRYFYESFDNLDAVAGALTDLLADEAIAVTVASLEAATTADEATRNLITAFVRHLTDDPRRARILLGAIPAGEAAAGHHAEAIRKFVATAASIGQGIHELPDSPPVRVAAAMVVGGTNQAILDWLDNRITTSQDELIDLLVAQWQVVGREAANQTGRSVDPV